MCIVQADLPLCPAQLVSEYHGTKCLIPMDLLQSCKEHQALIGGVEHITEGVGHLCAQQILGDVLLYQSHPNQLAHIAALIAISVVQIGVDQGTVCPVLTHDGHRHHSGAGSGLGVRKLRVVPSEELRDIAHGSNASPQGGATGFKGSGTANHIVSQVGLRERERCQLHPSIRSIKI